MRAAAQFVKVAKIYESDIQVIREGTSVNGKSIMGVLMLAAGRGTRIVISAEGRDAAEALEALGTLINNKFGEE